MVNKLIVLSVWSASTQIVVTVCVTDAVAPTCAPAESKHLIVVVFVPDLFTADTTRAVLGAVTETRSWIATVPPET